MTPTLWLTSRTSQDPSCWRPPHLCPAQQRSCHSAMRGMTDGFTSSSESTRYKTSLCTRIQCCHRPRGQTGRAHCAVASCREAALATQYCCMHCQIRRRWGLGEEAECARASPRLRDREYIYLYQRRLQSQIIRGSWRYQLPLKIPSFSETTSNASLL
jgi:hypothetical protein